MQVYTSKTSTYLDEHAQLAKCCKNYCRENLPPNLQYATSSYHIQFNRVLILQGTPSSHHIQYIVESWILFKSIAPPVFLIWNANISDGSMFQNHHSN